MGAMFEGGYRIKDGKIQALCEGDEHYDVDWGMYMTLIIG